jgi:hypothetical protein
VVQIAWPNPPHLNEMQPLLQCSGRGQVVVQVPFRAVD